MNQGVFIIEWIRCIFFLMLLFIWNYWDREVYICKGFMESESYW